MAHENITDDHFLTVNDLAKIICLNKFTIYHLLKKSPKSLPAVTRKWGRVLFLRSNVNLFIAEIKSGNECNSDSTPARRGRGRPRKNAQ